MNQIKSNHEKKYYFMSGLPRSGSTLLSSLLNQNPRFYSGPSSPVVSTMLSLEQSLSNDELFLAYPKREQAAKIISSVIEHYYSDVDKPIIFDKNRSWTNRLHYIPGYFNIEPKVLCPVRSIDEILTSFIMMQRRNPLRDNERINFLDEMLIKNNIILNDDNRCEFLASTMGILGQSYNGLKECLEQGNQKSLHFIEYDDLINDPENTMRGIYDFLEEEYYSHDFSKIKNLHHENDKQVYGMEGMHDVRSALKKVSPNPKEILSEKVLQSCINTEFWRELDVENDEIQYQRPTDPVEINFSNQSETNDNPKIIGE
jgi:sulfotransferase